MTEGGRPKGLPAKAPAQAKGLPAESAYYALQRRLAAALRHHLVVHLQPIGLLTDVMAHRLKSATPDLRKLGEDLEKIETLRRSAISSALDVITWIAPEEGNAVTLATGVADCLALLTSHLSFRGFRIEAPASWPEITVSQSAIRNGLSACLLSLSDGAAKPARIILSAGENGALTELHIELAPFEDGTDAEPGEDAGIANYRKLEWPDVQAIALAEGLKLKRDSAKVTLTPPKR